LSTGDVTAAAAGAAPLASLCVASVANTFSTRETLTHSADDAHRLDWKLAPNAHNTLQLRCEAGADSVLCRSYLGRQP